MPRFNLFTKIVMLIIIMLVPIVGLYVYSNHTTTEVLRDELNKSNESQLRFFQSQVNTNFDLLTLMPNQLIHDPDISSFRDIYLNEQHLNLNAIMLVKRIQNKLSLQESSLNWKSNLFVYSPSLQRVISLSDAARYDQEELLSRLRPGWQVTRQGDGPYPEFVFSLLTVSPASAFNKPAEAELIIELRFNSSNIRKMLDGFKSDGRRDPFYYKEDQGIIYNTTADKELTNRLVKAMEDKPFEQQIEHRSVELDGKTYMVNILYSTTTGWYLIDYMPTSDIMAPIEQSNSLFYSSITVLLMMSCLAAYLLYAQVQVPIRTLVRSFQRLKNGDYSVRLVPRGKSEFSYVFTRFNSMVTQIQELIENVLMEKIHTREARLKQLQSQINPHFFYNCFSFISSMAKLKNVDAVVAMSNNLSKYYRYTTRQERELVPVSEEMDFVINYLEIQKMRMSRLNYEVEMPAELHRLELPSLVIQPLVENAVIHGIEPRSGAGMIHIKGERLQEEQLIRITVEDNGCGMGEQELLTMNYKLSEPMTEEMGYGLWNVQQRMMLRYGAGEGLRLEASALGGLKVTLTWKEPRSEDG